jgi:predicted nucleic acid-binding protein
MPDKRFFIDSKILIYVFAREGDLSHKKQMAVNLTFT